MFNTAGMTVAGLCAIHNHMLEMIENPRDCDYVSFNKGIADVKRELIERKHASEYVLQYEGKL